jgi:hypothetical protein
MRGAVGQKGANELKDVVAESVLKWIGRLLKCWERRVGSLGMGDFEGGEGSVLGGAVLPSFPSVPSSTSSHTSHPLCHNVYTSALIS